MSSILDAGWVTLELALGSHEISDSIFMRIQGWDLWKNNFEDWINKKLSVR